MAQRLDEFIARHVDVPFVWGKADCALFLADWWRENHGTDPASHLRGAYSTEIEKSDIVSRGGSLVLLVDRICTNIGAREVFRHSEIKPGDFGIIAPGVGAIFTGEYWAARAETGLILTQRARVWRVWSIDG